MTKSQKWGLLAITIVIVLILWSAIPLLLRSKGQPLQRSEPLVSRETDSKSVPEVLEPIRDEIRPNQPLPRGQGTIVGRVYLPDGTVAQGAMIRAVWSEKGSAALASYSAGGTGASPANETSQRWTTETDEHGVFRIESLPWGWYGVLAHSQDAMAVTGDRLDAEHSVKVFRLVLERGLPLAGTVSDVQGAPIGGARLIPLHHDGQDLQGYMASALVAVSDVAGGFAFDILASQTWELYVYADGYAPAWTEPIPVGTRDAKIVLHKGAVVAGVVVESEQRKPVSGVQLTANKEKDRHDVRKVVSDDAGAFIFSQLAPGAYVLFCNDPRWTMKNGSEKVETKEETNIENLVLEVSEGGTVTGRVADADTEEGIAGVTVAAFPQKHPMLSKRSAPTDSNGSFSITGLAPDSYRVTPSLLESDPRSQPKLVNVQLGSRLEGVDFLVRRATLIAGKVLDAERQPVKDAVVTWQVFSGPQGRCSSDAQGAFAAVGPRENEAVYLSAETPTAKSKRVGPVIAGVESGRNVELVLDQGFDGVIAGYVVDGSGRPRRARVVARTGENIPGLAGGYQTMTDGEGNFVIPVITPGDYQMEVAASGSGDFLHGFMQVATVALKPGESRRGLRLVYDERNLLSISGRITDEAGNPVEGAQVNTATTTGAHNDFAVSGPDGRYTVTGLDDDTYTIMARHPKYRQAARENVRAGSDSADLVMREWSRVAGQVLDAKTRAPIPNFEIAVNLMLPGHFRFEPRYRPVADAEGRFSCEVTPPTEDQSLILSARAGGYSAAQVSLNMSEDVDVLEGIIVELLPGAGVVEGRVLDADGQPLAAAQIFPGPIPRDHSGAAAVTDADGYFRVENFPADVSEIGAYRSDLIEGSVAVQSGSTAIQSVEIVLDQPGIIEGVVTDDGQPVSGAIIIAPRGPQPIRTDANGHYRIERVVPGTVTVRIQLHLPQQPGERPPVLEREAIVAPNQTTRADFDAGQFEDESPEEATKTPVRNSAGRGSD
ncbi:MAG: carboxypeptidase regulatory-like domain-containing protein [Candidatus Hydrogenedentes bacterium]|nr:carboxypeptidase regulatory-like domain-containing protein [Candidatus Hydrogenedentota bacterium]